MRRRSGGRRRRGKRGVCRGLRRHDQNLQGVPRNFPREAAIGTYAAAKVTTEDSGPSISGPWRWALFALALAGAIVFYVLTIPRTVPASALPDRTPDLANGEYMFNAGGCASCHAEPAVKCRDPKIKHARLLGGGRCMRTDFGIFYVPNISPDKDSGIGTWTTLDFINAMKRGIGPGGAHLYPAFPYASY